MSLFTCQNCYPKLCRCPEHRPKGGMCVTCAHRLRDCSGLDFRSMPVISTHTDGGAVGFKIVRCVAHERAK